MTIFDESILRRLETDLGKEGLHVMLDVFRMEVADRRKEIAALAATGDLDGARVSSHALKAASRSVGALGLSVAAAFLEEAFENGDSPVLDRLNGESERALDYLEGFR